MYLLTCPHGTIAGVFRLPDGYACEDLQWSPERVVEGFAELFRNGFANRCETTKWVWVIKHLEWNPPENPNQRKSAAKVSMQIPDDCAWKADFMRVCGESLGLELAPKTNGSATVPQPLPNQEQEQEQEQVNPIAQPDGFADFWSAYPRKVGKGAAERAFRKSKIGKTLLPNVLKAIERARSTEQWRKDGGQFIPHPATWLNERRWEDEPESIAKPGVVSLFAGCE